MVARTSPAASIGCESVQPGEVCRVIWLRVFSCTPSTMSISPLEGQLGPTLGGVSSSSKKCCARTSRKRARRRGRVASTRRP